MANGPACIHERHVDVFYTPEGKAICATCHPPASRRAVVCRFGVQATGGGAADVRDVPGADHHLEGGRGGVEEPGRLLPVPTPLRLGDDGPQRDAAGAEPEAPRGA